MAGIKQNHYPQRRSIRLEGYDYRSEGGYFVTIVTNEMKPLFGEIYDGKMRLNENGQIVKEEWFKTPEIRPQVELLEDEFVVMPNHIHGIIWIFEKDDTSAIKPDSPGTGTARRARTINHFNIPSEIENPTPFKMQFSKPISNSLSTIVGAYKSAVTKRINRLRGTPGITIWHRNFYEHIICTDKEYENIVNYIYFNPENWGSKDYFDLIYPKLNRH
jgi:putative transposase